jgi:hypothetical protein
MRLSLTCMIRGGALPTLRRIEYDVPDDDHGYRAGELWNYGLGSM